MREIINYNLEVKVITYNTEQERDEHISYMEKMGWKVRRDGQYMMSAESTTTAFCNDDNWYYYAEYCKEKQTNIEDENKSYESDLYYFGFYNQKED